MPKSPDAFRTISEVADWLGIQAHVLRFWESKFAQVKPIKRAGGRRYYRPNDMLLLGGIRQLLHEDGLTIKGVQKVLREEGVGHVASLSQPLDEVTQIQLDDVAVDEAPMMEAAEPESAVVLNFEARQDAPEAPESELTAETPEPAVEVLQEAQDLDDVEDAAPELPLEEAPTEPAEVSDQVAQEAVSEAEPEPEAEAEPQPEPEPEPEPEPAPEIEPEEEPDVQEAAAPTEQPEPDSTEDEPASSASELPAFLQRPMEELPATKDNAPAAEEAPVEDIPAPKPRIIDVPLPTSVDDIPAAPALLTSAYRVRHLSTDQAREMTPLLAKLRVLRDSMAGRRPGGFQSGPDA